MPGDCFRKSMFHKAPANSLDLSYLRYNSQILHKNYVVCTDVKTTKLEIQTQDMLGDFEVSVMLSRQHCALVSWKGLNT